MDNDIFHSRETLLAAVKNKLESADAAEEIVSLMDIIQRDAYSRGRRSVQQEIIKALDLKHLIGCNH